MCREQGQTPGQVCSEQLIAFHKGRDSTKDSAALPWMESPPRGCLSLSGASWTQGVSGGVWLRTAAAPRAEPQCDTRGSEELDQTFILARVKFCNSLCESLAREERSLFMRQTIFYLMGFGHSPLLLPGRNSRVNLQFKYRSVVILKRNSTEENVHGLNYLELINCYIK